MPTVTVPIRIKLQNILFATDFSPSAQSALSYAINLARHYEAGMYTVNVLPPLPFVEAAQPDPAQARFLAEQRMADLIGSKSFKNLRHKELIGRGEVPEVLSKLVREYDMDLIVIGTGGREGLGKFLLGSVAEEVFRLAECPVLTVGPHAIHGKLDGNLRHILFATDFGTESLYALPYAISFAEENRARLTLLHVAPEPHVALPEPGPGTMVVLDRSEVVAFTEQQLRTLIREETQLWHEPEYMVEFGSPAETVVKIAAETADMIVIGVKRPGLMTKHLGAGVAYKITCGARCPVLSVSSRYLC